MASANGSTRRRGGNGCGWSSCPGYAEVEKRVAVWLCCTVSGVGAASVIEASRMASSGALTLTGGLGEAMQAGLDWVRSNPLLR